jgi:hypothetical protein
MTLNTKTIHAYNRQVSISFDNNAATAFLYLGVRADPNLSHRAD